MRLDENPGPVDRGLTFLTRGPWKQAPRRSYADCVMAEKRARPRVLLIDDDKNFRDLLRAWLIPEFEFYAFPDGGSILETLDQIRPDLLLLDVRMLLDGFRLCREIRSQRSYDKLPIIFITGCSTVDDFIESADAGGTDYILKPVTRRQLLNKLNRWLRAPKAEALE